MHLTRLQMHVKGEGQESHMFFLKKIAVVMQGFDIMSSVLTAARIQLQCMW